MKDQISVNVIYFFQDNEAVLNNLKISYYFLQ